MKNKFKIALLSVVFAASSLMATSDSYSYNAKSLVGLEFGYNQVNGEYGLANQNNTFTSELGSFGLKLGAETDDFRAFLSARYMHQSASDNNYLVTGGGELQYKFNIASFMNLFLGANAGIASTQFRNADDNYTQTLTTPYIGGDIGTNIHLGKKMDLELGGRYMHMEATTDADAVTGKSYKLKGIASAYLSLIFRWTMD